MSDQINLELQILSEKYRKKLSMVVLATCLAVGLIITLNLIVLSLELMNSLSIRSGPRLELIATIVIASSTVVLAFRYIQGVINRMEQHGDEFMRESGLVEVVMTASVKDEFMEEFSSHQHFWQTGAKKPSREMKLGDWLDKVSEQLWMITDYPSLDRSPRMYFIVIIPLIILGLIVRYIFQIEGEGLNFWVWIWMGIILFREDHVQKLVWRYKFVDEVQRRLRE